MDCLKGYIGIHGCGAPTTTPGSGLFINQLPGISVEIIEAIANDEEENYLGVWATVETRALLKFALAVKAEFNKCFKITDKDVLECLIFNNKDLFAVALWYFLGTELMIQSTSSTRVNRFTTIDREDAEKMKSEFYSEFATALSDAVQSINPVENDCVPGCVESNADLRWVEHTP